MPRDAVSRTANVRMVGKNGLMVLGVFPPGKFPHPPRFSVAKLFRVVASFAHVVVEDSSRNRFESTVYFAKPGTFWGESSGGGGIFRPPLQLDRFKPQFIFAE